MGREVRRVSYWSAVRTHRVRAYFTGPRRNALCAALCALVFLLLVWWILWGNLFFTWDAATRPSTRLLRSVGLVAVLLFVSLTYLVVYRTARLRAAVQEGKDELRRTVAELTQMEEALEIARARFAGIVDISDAAIISVDEGQRISLFNQGAEKTFGYRAEEILGEPLSTLIPPRFVEAHSRHVEGFASSPDALRPMNERGLVWGLRKDRTEFPAEASISKFEVQGQKVLTVRLRDMTERKRLEAQIRQAQKMEAIGRLAGGIAHDFNNILSTMIGYTEVATDDVLKGSRTWQNLQEVLAAGKRASDMVKQILAFSRQAEQERKPIPLHQIVREAMRLLRATLPATIQIRQHIDPESGMVLADTTQMHQVLMNLCANADFAMRERGGVLEVRLEAVGVDRNFATQQPPLTAGPHVRLTIRDTGHGMDSGVKEQIFDPFFTTKEQGEGIGMGLAVVHGIIAGHGGTITVDSAPGQGATFTIHLPRCDSIASSEAPEEEPIRGGRERILLIEDEPFLASLWERMLQGLGYEVTMRTRSTEALENFRARPASFDLVITDQTMPHVTGEEVAREFLRIRPNVPIILCTGFSHTMTEEKARAMGIRAYLMKPFGRRDLSRAIRRVLDERVG